LQNPFKKLEHASELELQQFARLIPSCCLAIVLAQKILPEPSQMGEFIIKNLSACFQSNGETLPKVYKQTTIAIVLAYRPSLRLTRHCCKSVTIIHKGSAHQALSNNNPPGIHTEKTPKFGSPNIFARSVQFVNQPNFSPPGFRVCDNHLTLKLQLFQSFWFAFTVRVE
jgi:hypothetical protein